jgi:CheY-like chemotaxis protein
MWPKILCVEENSALLESRCAILEHSGYDVASTPPRGAAILLQSRKFDLLILSSLSDSDLHRLVNVSDGAKVLVLDDFTRPADLLALVKERLGTQQRA